MVMQRFFRQGSRATNRARTLLASKIAEPLLQAGASGQRTYGNRAVSRTLQRAPAHVIQRASGDGKDEGEEKKGSAPLMLTDRPWSAIEQHGMPKFNPDGTPQLPQLFGGNDLKFPMVIPGLAEMLKAFEDKQKAEQPPVLLLTDRPWEEIEADRLKKVTKAKASEEERLLFIANLEKRLAAIRQSVVAGDLATEITEFESTRMDEKSKGTYANLGTTLQVSAELGKLERLVRQRTKEHWEARKKAKLERERMDFIASIQSRIATSKAQAGSKPFAAEYDPIEKRHLSKQGMTLLASKKRRAEASGKVAAVETKVTRRTNELDAKKNLEDKIKDFAAIGSRIFDVLTMIDTLTVAKNRTYFDGVGEASEVLTNEVPILTAARSTATARIKEMRLHTAALESSASADDTVLNTATTALNGPLDDTVTGANPHIVAAENARQHVVNFNNLNAKRTAIIDAAKVDPARLLHQNIATWLARKFSGTGTNTKAELQAALAAKILEQHDIPKTIWMRDILGFTKRDRSPNPALYMKAGAKVSGKETHISIFANSIDATGGINVNGTNAATVVDQLFSTSQPATAQDSSHITMEVWAFNEWNRKRPNPNPHIFRGGPRQPRDILERMPDADWNTIATDLDAAFTAVRNAAAVEITKVLNAKGTKFWPVLPK